MNQQSILLQLTGLGEIEEDIHIIPIGQRWAVLQNESQLNFISLSECEQKGGI